RRSDNGVSLAEEATPRLALVAETMRFSIAEQAHHETGPAAVPAGVHCTGDRPCRPGGAPHPAGLCQLAEALAAQTQLSRRWLRSLAVVTIELRGSLPRHREPGRDAERNDAATMAPCLAYWQKTLKSVEKQGELPGCPRAS